MDQAAIEREPSRLRRCLLILGPGITSGASNNDPSAVAVYAKTGAALGFTILWVAPLLFPMMAASVYLSAKLSMVSGRGLAGVLRENFPRWLVPPVVFGLVIANTFGAGADIGAVAAGIELIAPLPRAVTIIGVAVLMVILQIWGSYRAITSTFKWLTLALFAFVGAGLLARPDAAQVLFHTFIPTVRLDSGFLSMMVAMLGTSLSPYLFFWQTGQRIEEERCAGRRRLWQRRGATEGELKYASLDVNVGMLFGCLIIYFILLSSAATLNLSGQRDVQSTADAAAALRPLAGRFASVLFAIGFIGSGLLAVPVLTTGVAYALSEMFGWPFGLGRPPRMAPHFYLTIVASTLVGTLVNFVGLSPITALFVAAVLNGMLAPFVLVLIMISSNSRRIMGAKVNGLGVNILGWASAAISSIAAVAMAATLIRAWFAT